MMLQLDIMAILPELILFFGAMGLLMVGVFSSSNMSRPISMSSIILLLIATVVVLFQSEEAQFAFNGALLMNDFTALMKALTFLAVAASLVLAHDFMHLEKIERFEYPVLVLLASCGMSIMISANDLIAVYMGLELQSLALYVVASINRDSVRSTEAGLKYFVLGALSSGMLLYGVSLIYGFSGTVNFQELASLGFTGNDIGLVFGMVFLMAGLAFKISAVPFHMWTPDVYEGAPTPVTAFLAVAPKLAAMALFMRAVITIFPQAQDAWQQIIIFMSLASMVLGSLAAIGQQSIKRLMAYSSIGHIGFALVGFAAIAGDKSAEGVSGVIIYVIIYSVMTIGTFACILSMRRSQGMVEQIDDLSGLSQTRPFMAFCLAVFMFSMAGIPPLAGFFGKFYVFKAAINAELYILAVLGVLTSVIGAYYYLRIVKIMYLDAPDDEVNLPMPRNLGFLAGASAFLMILFFIYPKPLVSVVDNAADAFLEVDVQPGYVHYQDTTK